MYFLPILANFEAKQESLWPKKGAEESTPFYYVSFLVQKLSGEITLQLFQCIFICFEIFDHLSFFYQDNPVTYIGNMV